jgi:hypothetical protein
MTTYYAQAIILIACYEMDLEVKGDEDNDFPESPKYAEVLPITT